MELSSLAARGATSHGHRAAVVGRQVAVLHLVAVADDSWSPVVTTEWLSKLWKTSRAHTFWFTELSTTVLWLSTEYE